MKRLFKKMLTLFLWVVVCLAVALLVFQSRLIYHPRGYPDVGEAPGYASALEYSTPQGRQVAWLNPKQEGKPERVWLVFCGNGTVALDYAGYFNAQELKHDLFVLFDYPSYGRSQGMPSPASIRESIVALMPAVAEKLSITEAELKPKLRVFGHSLGCAAALMAMEAHDIKEGVLVAPFTSMLDMSRRVVGWPLCWLLYHRFDNTGALERLKARGDVHLRLFHGTADEVIPVAMGQELAKRFPDMIHFEAVPNARHNDIIDTDRSRILAAMTQLR